MKKATMVVAAALVAALALLMLIGGAEAARKSASVEYIEQEEEETAVARGYYGWAWYNDASNLIGYFPLVNGSFVDLTRQTTLEVLPTRIGNSAYSWTTAVLPTNQQALVWALPNTENIDNILEGSRGAGLVMGTKGNAAFAVSFLFTGDFQDHMYGSLFGSQNGQNPGANSVSMSLSTMLYSPGGLHVIPSLSVGGSTQWYAALAAPAPWKWVHVVVTYDGTPNASPNLYWNGELLTVSGPTARATFTAPPGEMMIGASAVTGSSPYWNWPGAIMQFRHFTRSISAAEVSQVLADDVNLYTRPQVTNANQYGLVSGQMLPNGQDVMLPNSLMSWESERVPRNGFQYSPSNSMWTWNNGGVARTGSPFDNAGRNTTNGRQYAFVQINPYFNSTIDASTMTGMLANMTFYGQYHLEFQMSVRNYGWGWTSSALTVTVGNTVVSFNVVGNDQSSWTPVRTNSFRPSGRTATVIFTVQQPSASDSSILLDSLVLVQDA